MSSTGQGPASNGFTSYNDKALTVIICSALAGYNAIELLLLIFTTFTTYRGLYFWSLLVATSGVVPYVIGLCLFYFKPSAPLAGYIINNYGWWTMITGQSMVLYSRLGIVLGKGHDKLLRFVKWMIIVDGIAFCSSATVVVFGSHYSSNPLPFATAYTYIERIQMTGFTIQEFIISGIYVWKTLDILRTGRNQNKHRIMWQLLTINVIIIILDIGLLALEYRNLFIHEVAFKALSYSVKLKLEFAILSKLVEFSNTSIRRFSTHFADTTGFLDGSGRAQSFATRTASSPTLDPGSRPQWMHDVEKIGVAPAAVHTTTSDLSEDLHIERDPHNFESKVIGHGRCNTYESDLMYAEAMRVVSK